MPSLEMRAEVSQVTHEVDVIPFHGLLLEVSHYGFFVDVAASLTELMYTPQFCFQLIVILLSFLPIGSPTRAAYSFSAWRTEIEVIDAAALSDGH
ncbi:hypothetical protein WS98_19665 [Burkholderia territorii]|nr:hypothetical protein WS98_19665 [Burkholderia territorii]